MERTGKLFNSLLAVLSFGSLIFLCYDRPDGDELFTLFSFMFLVVLSFLVKPVRDSRLGLTPALFFLAFATMFFQFRDPVRSSVMNLFVGITAMKVIADRLDLNARYVGISVACYVVLSNVMILLQNLGMEPLYQPLFDQEIAAFSFRPWILGCSAVLSIPFLYLLHPLWLIALLPMLFFSKSSICVFAAVISVLIIYWNRIPKKWKVAGFFGAMALFVGYLFVESRFFVENEMQPDRMLAWQNAPLVMKEHIFGEGLGAWAHSAFIHKNGEFYEWWRWAHNEWVQQLFEQGATGFLLAMFWAIITLCLTEKVETRAGLVGLYILCCVHPVMHWGKLVFLVVILLSKAFAENSKKNSLTFA